LRILVIRSEPLDCEPLDLAAEWAEVSASLAGLTAVGTVTFTELAVPTLKELRKALLHDTFHVIHYMGHGSFDSENGGALLFTDNAGLSAPATATDLGVMLHDHDSLRLATLNACQAGRTDPTDPFAGVADTLVRRGVPAVVAMQFEVSDQAACEFAPALYGALAAGRPVDEAVAEARKAMYTVSPLEWATPVLYLRTDDARLFDVTAGVRQQGGARADDPEPVPSASPATIAAARRGDSLYTLGQYTDAEAAYREAVRVDPSYAPGHESLGNALRSLERNAEAEAAYRDAIRLDPELAGARYGLGRVLYDKKQYDEAARSYREAIRLDPTDADSHMGLGIAQAANGSHSSAVDSYREAIRLEPSVRYGYFNLGNALYELGRYGEAETAFREAITANPSDGDGYQGLGNSLDGQGRHREAEKALRKAIDLTDGPGLAQLYANFGKTLFNNGKHDEGIEALREAIDLDPDLAFAHRVLSIALENTKRYTEARKERREADRLDSLQRRR
jgi:tetratricopeptide (TPR) repeat protein